MMTGLDVSSPPPGANPLQAATCDGSSLIDARTADGLPEFLRLRPRLFGVAYRMLGSAAEAEDIAQDVWLRWQTTDRSAVRNPAAFLITTAARLAINVLQSARARRETCVGAWLPEVVDTDSDPTAGVDRGETLRAAILRLLETLSPTERAGYVLREAFNYQYREIAGVLHVKEANARQIVTRARERVAGGRRTVATSTEASRLLNAIVAAASTGELALLESLFATSIP
jgi:RNA polymerase sigma-70 factor (ECF subfamily)